MASNQSGSIRNQAIAYQLRIRNRIDGMNDIGMNLAQRHQRQICRLVLRPAIRAHFEQERSPVSLDGGFGVVFRKAQVERILAVGAGESAAAGRKTVNQPGNFAQVHGAKNGGFG